MSRLISEIAHCSAVGQRPAQEDFGWASAERGVFAVADGFGGPSAGSAASKLACEAVQAFLVKEVGDREATLPFVIRHYYSLAGNVLFNALVHSNRKLLSKNRNRSVHEKAGASLVAGFLDGDQLSLGSIGSCQAWIFRQSGMAELTTPRSYGRLLDPFKKEATLCEEGVPLAALGLNEDLEPEILECRIHSGDGLFLHTDGLLEGERQKLWEAFFMGRGAALEALNELQGEQGREDNLWATLIFF